jgi:ATP-dependent DNA helicase RecG
MISGVSPIADQDLEKIARDIESDRVERKEALSDTDRVAQAVCAFANDLPGHGLPGYVLLGVSDAGLPTGLPITDQLLRTLGELWASGNILPLPSLVVSKRVLDGREIALVEVMPLRVPPVRYKGAPWIRIGPRRAIATAEEETRLAERRRAADLPFDARPFPYILASASRFCRDHLVANRTSWWPIGCRRARLDDTVRRYPRELRFIP